jgi:hypothetical protein
MINKTTEIKDVIGKPAKVGDYIVHQQDFQILVDKIKEIKNTNHNHIKTEDGYSILPENFLIINCIVEENPERFI